MQKSLAPLAGIQLFSFAARGLIQPFLNLYLIAQGFTGTELGFLLSASALMQLFIIPALSMMADRTGRHRRLYYIFLFASTMAVLAYVAPFGKLWLVAAFLLYSATDPLTATLAAQLTITWLEQRGFAIFGRIRSFGSLGWALTLFFSGRIIAVGGYQLTLFVAGIINLLSLPLIRVLPERTTEKRTQQTTTTVARTRGFYILMVVLFIYYLGQSAMFNFSMIFFTQTLGASNEYVGQLYAVAALIEIPFMIGMDWLIRRINIRYIFIVGLGGMGFLAFSYATMVGTTLLLPLLILRSLFFTLWSITLFLLISRISNPLNIATNQALAQATLVSLAGALSSPVSGWIFDNFGTRPLFVIAGCVISIAVVILLVFQRHLVEHVQPVDEIVLPPTPEPI